MINEESPYTCLKKAGGTVSCSHQQLSHASDSQGPQTPSGALIHSVRRSSPGLSWSHWGSHSSDPHPFRQGVLTWPLLVSPGVSQLGPLSVLSRGPHCSPSPVSLGVSPPGLWCCPRPCTKPDVTREGPL